MELENLDNGGRVADVPHGLPGKGRPAGLPVRGMPMTSGDEDGNAGTFYVPACTGQNCNFRGGKTPCWGSTGQRFQVELTKTVTNGSPRTEEDTKYVTHHKTACST